jgi:hypothetical protein
MMKKQLKLFTVAALMLGINGPWLASSVCAATSTSVQYPLPVTVAARPVQLPARLPNTVAFAMPHARVAGNSGVLDVRRQLALGMIETGNDDREIGGCGEVSRYQILPSVWRHYSDSRNYHDPQVSREVARRHWTALYNAFKQQAGREPTDFDMYVLWNTHYGYYSGRHFDPARLAPVVRDRAQRYANLVQRYASMVEG